MNLKYIGAMRRTLAAVALLASVSAGVMAQSESGYFLDGYTYRFQMNPAFANERGFVSFPGLGSFNFGMTGNMSVNQYLYYKNGKTVTFLSPLVGVDEAMGRIHDTNKTGIQVRETILAGGFKAFGGYNTVAVNAVSDVNIAVPGSIFSLLKQGVANKTYDITDLHATGRAYAEIQLGHSRKIDDKLRVGANVKILVGLADIDADMKSARLNLGTNRWTITSDAEINVAMANFSYKHKKSNSTGKTYVNGGDLDKFGVSGFGFGVDLGAVYDLTPDIQLSASVTDLGVISYTNNHLASTNGTRTFDSDIYTFNPDDKADNNFDNEWDRIKDQLGTLYQLSDMGEDGSRTAVLHSTINVGGRYILPSYRKVSFGLLSTTRLQGDFTWSNVRLSANYAPAKVFDMGVNFVGGTNCVGFGWLLNLHCPGFNLSAGMDHLSGMFNKQSIPLGSNTSLNLGINFLL